MEDSSTRVQIARGTHAIITTDGRFIEFNLYSGNLLIASGAHLKAAGWDFNAIVKECDTIVQEAKTPPARAVAERR